MDQLIESFPFGAVFAAAAAVACYRTVVLQSRGRTLKLWQLSIAPFFGGVAGATMLYRASLATPCLAAWSLVLIGGAVIGAATVRSVPLQVDHVFRLIRVNWGMDGALAALVILLGACAGALFGVFGNNMLVWACATAIAAGSCAGLLGGRAWALGKRVLYAVDNSLAGS